MRGIRIVIGTLILLIAASAVLAGVWVLREAGGGGLSVIVEFEDAGNINVDDQIIYGDTIVGRVEGLTEEDGRYLVHARIASENADLPREGSRFWVSDLLGSSILMFDTPTNAGDTVGAGHRYVGLPEPPEPDPNMAPMQKPRKLSARPAWLCEVRVTLELDAGGDLAETQRRKTTGAVVNIRESGDLLVLAPSWVAQYSGDLITERFRVELTGGATMIAEPLHIKVPLMVLLVRGTNYAGNPAPLWGDTLADEQGLLLSDFEGLAYTANHVGGEVSLDAQVDYGSVALIDGTNVAGFTIPAVGRNYGVRWISLKGAGSAVDAAVAKLE